MLSLLPVSILPAAVTLFLPRRWLLLWLPLLAGAGLWMLDGLEEVDGPGGLAAYAVVGEFLLLNVPATLGRLIFLVVGIHAESMRSYSG